MHAEGRQLVALRRRIVPRAEQNRTSAGSAPRLLPGALYISARLFNSVTILGAVIPPLEYCAYTIEPDYQMAVLTHPWLP